MLSFQKGDKASFEILMRKYFPRVLNFIYRFTGSRETAEELTQDVFIRVYRNASYYKPQAKFQTWLFQIAKNLSLNEIRRNKPFMVSIEEDIEIGDGAAKRQIEDLKIPAPDQYLLAEETEIIVKQAIDQLPESQRLAVLLRRYEDFSYEEIAQSLHCSVKAVKSILSRARERLKEQLSDYFKDGKDS